MQQITLRHFHGDDTDDWPQFWAKPGWASSVMVAHVCHTRYFVMTNRGDYTRANGRCCWPCATIAASPLFSSCGWGVQQRYFKAERLKPFENERNNN